MNHGITTAVEQCSADQCDCLHTERWTVVNIVQERARSLYIKCFLLICWAVWMRYEFVARSAELQSRLSLHQFHITWQINRLSFILSRVHSLESSKCRSGILLSWFWCVILQVNKKSTLSIPSFIRNIKIASLKNARARDKISFYCFLFQLRTQKVGELNSNNRIIQNNLKIQIRCIIFQE